MEQKKGQQGFSLIELLIVVAIIGIIAAIAIPNLLASRRAANEASAIGTMRTISSAEATYQSTVGQGSYTDLTGLNGQGLIDNSVSGSSSTSPKSGFYYVVTWVNTTPQQYNSNATAASTAQGSRRFSSDQTGVIYGDTSNPTTAQTTTSGTPIGN